MSEEQKDWINVDIIAINDFDVLNGVPYEECSQIQQMLYHIIKDYQIKNTHLESEVDKLKIDVLHLISELDKLKEK